jgi:hypothetical protein
MEERSTVKHTNTEGTAEQESDEVLGGRYEDWLVAGVDNEFIINSPDQRTHETRIAALKDVFMSCSQPLINYVFLL